MTFETILENILLFTLQISLHLLELATTEVTDWINEVAVHFEGDFG